MHSLNFTLFHCICQDVPPFFFFITKEECLSEAPGGAIIALLVVSTQHRDNVSWANERQRREDILTSIDPCKEEAAVGSLFTLRNKYHH